LRFADVEEAVGGDGCGFRIFATIHELAAFGHAAVTGLHGVLHGEELADSLTMRRADLAGFEGATDDILVSKAGQAVRLGAEGVERLGWSRLANDLEALTDCCDVLVGVSR